VARWQGPGSQVQAAAVTAARRPKPNQCPTPITLDPSSLPPPQDIKYVGFELWQVKSGSIFDNIIVTDDLAAAKKLAEETWKKNKDGEKAMMEKAKKVGRWWWCC
jgi:hypothetical protein